MFKKGQANRLARQDITSRVVQDLDTQITLSIKNAQTDLGQNMATLFAYAFKETQDTGARWTVQSDGIEYVPYFDYNTWELTLTTPDGSAEKKFKLDINVNLTPA